MREPRDLVDVYAEANHTKEAWLRSPALDPETRAKRDAIEASIQAEKNLRRRAEAQLRAAERRAERARTRKGPPFERTLDAVRALVPGLSISASANDGHTKQADEGAEFARPGRGRIRRAGNWLFDIGHALAGLTGAGAGAAYQAGMVPGGRAAALQGDLFASGDAVTDLMGRLFEGTPQDQGGRIRDAVGRLEDLLRRGRTPGAADLQQRLTAVDQALAGTRGASQFRTAFARDPHQFILAAQRPSRLSRILAPVTTRTLERWGDSPVTRGQAVASARPAMAAAGVTRSALRRALRTSVPAARRITKTPSPGWRTYAGIGAVAASLPFALARFARTRRLRRKGGPAVSRALTQAHDLMDQAVVKREQRGRLLEQLREGQ